MDIREFVESFMQGKFVVRYDLFLEFVSEVHGSLIQQLGRPLQTVRFVDRQYPHLSKPDKELMVIFLNSLYMSENGVGPAYACNMLTRDLQRFVDRCREYNDNLPEGERIKDINGYIGLQIGDSVSNILDYTTGHEREAEERKIWREHADELGKRFLKMQKLEGDQDAG